MALLEKKDFAYITVKEICERAGVNRSTFYLHYETVNDLLEESTQYILDRFMSYMPVDPAHFIDELPQRPLEELYLITPEYLTPYLTFVKEHKHIFRVSLEQSSALKLDSIYGNLTRHVLTPILNRFSVPAAAQRYILEFYISGIMAIIRSWLEEDCEAPIEHIISVMQTCIRQHRPTNTQ